ncbi:MAG: plsC [Paenibacillaceae bacterium]|jgi:1-acyl-sn-glycerol-3-phosphate acyltransferase|nr:plsC [Paenibacillaceae bacterium]
MLYSIGQTLCRILFYGIFRLKVIGRENIPATGGVILCSNHTSNLDPPLLGTPVPRKVRFMAKAELFKVPLLGAIIHAVGAFPIKRGGVSKESLRLAASILEEGGVLGVFPEGTRKGSEVGKRGAASLALRSGAQVVPVAIIGKYIPFRRMKIIYGKPLDLSSCRDGGAKATEQATELIMQNIRRLIAENRD